MTTRPTTTFEVRVLPAPHDTSDYEFRTFADRDAAYTYAREREDAGCRTRIFSNRTLRCCGEVLSLDAFTNTCPECGTDYNGAGQRLAPRSQWGEETGEHWTECY